MNKKYRRNAQNPTDFRISRPHELLCDAQPLDAVMGRQQSTLFELPTTDNLGRKFKKIGSSTNGSTDGDIGDDARGRRRPALARLAVRSESIRERLPHGDHGRVRDAAHQVLQASNQSIIAELQ